MNIEIQMILDDLQQVAPDVWPKGTGFYISRLDWVNNGNETFSVVERFQHPEQRVDKVLDTISATDYFVLVLEGKDRNYLHEVYARTETEKENG